MISVAILDKIEDESKKIQNLIKDFTAFYTEEQVQFHVFEKGEQKTGLQQIGFLNMALVDVCTEAGLHTAAGIREQFPEVQILVIADATVSPLRYLTPAIRPVALLLRPIAEAHGRQTLKDFFLIGSGQTKETENAYFWAKTRDGTEKIPYSSIFYFEAREKKIFIRTKAVEYGIGGTIEKLLQDLPDNFIRCHRSYIINKDYIERIRFADGFAYLASSMMVPVSRSYKGELKEYVNGIGTA